MQLKRQQLKLKALDQPDLAATIDLTDAGITFGRAPENAVVLPADRFPYISGHHARIVRDGDHFYLEDLKSRNGTILNGKAIQRSALKSGDLIQLGREVGARFLLTSDSDMTRTLDLPVGSAAPRVSQSLSGTVVMKMRKALGLPEDIEALKDAPQRATRRALLLTLAVLVPLTVLAYLGYRGLADRQDAQSEEIRRQNQLIEKQLSNLTAQQSDRDRRWVAEMSKLETSRAALETERSSIRAELGDLEKSEKSSAEELARLRTALADTNRKLGQYKPVNLEMIEKSKQTKYREVLAATVYIEKRLVFREKGTERYLHRMGSGTPRIRKVTDWKDVHAAGAKSGSGFCIGPRGWIVTNAHVVDVPAVRKSIKIGGADVVMERRLEVVFSGTGRRHRARVLRVSDDGLDDYAVIKIEPFDGMPIIRNFSIDAVAPDSGGSTRLFGFPLGKKLRQKKDVVIASVFSGIVSRKVDPYIQVQAVVYPGISGGPMVDGEGRVVGIVTGVQTVGSQAQIASDIGFALPVHGLKKIWPPE